LAAAWPVRKSTEREVTCSSTSPTPLGVAVAWWLLAIRMAINLRLPKRRDRRSARSLYRPDRRFRFHGLSRPWKAARSEESAGGAEVGDASGFGAGVAGGAVAAERQELRVCDLAALDGLELCTGHGDGCGGRGEELEDGLDVAFQKASDGGRVCADPRTAGGQHDGGCPAGGLSGAGDDADGGVVVLPGGDRGGGGGVGGVEAACGEGSGLGGRARIGGDFQLDSGGRKLGGDRAESGGGQAGGVSGGGQDAELQNRNGLRGGGLGTGEVEGVTGLLGTLTRCLGAAVTASAVAVRGIGILPLRLMLVSCCWWYCWVCITVLSVI
jgi:hypothetical protein